MEKKYILTDETKVVDGHTLHRIKAVKDFRNVNKGDLGGWIEKEENLYHEGDCWVYDEAVVYGEAKVFEKARVFGQATVCEKAWVYGQATVYEKARVHGEAKVCEKAWVYGEAKVCGRALVYGEAKVYEKARVCGEARVYEMASVGLNSLVQSNHDIKVIGPIGSRSDFTTFTKSESGDILVFCGCFKGTIEEFEFRVREVHKNTRHGKEYLWLVQAMKAYYDINSQLLHGL